MKFKSENVLSSTIVHALHHTSGVKVTIPNLSNLTIDQFQKILLTHGMLTLLKREAEEENCSGRCRLVRNSVNAATIW